jgi:hypothetical protein
MADGAVANDWYRPGPSLVEFHRSSAFIRVLIGGRGSGKTTSVAVEAVARHCWQVPGAKVFLLRKTELSQDSTTIDTFQMCYGGLGPLYRNAPSSLFRSTNGGRNVRLPSEEAVRRYNQFLLTEPNKSQLDAWLEGEGEKWCSHLEFRGIPDEAKRDNKLRGYECSLAILIEADLMELEDLQMMLPCLRWKDAHGKFIEDVGVIIDTNPPHTRHWIAQLERIESEKPDSEFQFWHIATYENEHNLPPRYIERNIILPYGNNPAMLDRMLWGKYADAFDGQAVYDAFKRHIHAASPTRLPFPTGAYLVRGHDFGTSWASTWSAYWTEEELNPETQKMELVEYWWVLHAEAPVNSDIDKQCATILEVTAREFPFWNDRTICAGVLDFCDPAGAAKTDKGSSIAVMNTYGIHPKYTFKDRGLPKTISIVNRLIGLKNYRGQYVFQVDPFGCDMLCTAMAGGYRYPKEHEPNYGTGVPLKDGIYDHICDALRYPIINCMRLAKMPVEDVATPVGVLAHVPRVNPPRRWY